MELTVNSFGKGLQMDTNPLVLGNESLTDALNATFITMNGNEVILLNDMGNRRIDHAFLPSGYTPVGIKEYGGIIYVASYNPLTNRSQIGSFPSPERNMGEEYPELGADLKTNFSQNFTSGNDPNTFKVVLTNTQYVLTKLTDEVLHAGDKFVVYTDDNNGLKTEIKNNVSNFDNTENDKIITPKNKQYTLSLGVLNSLNEFIDITKTLVRWKVPDYVEGTSSKDHIISFDSDVTDLYKFNCGYFIYLNDFSNYNEHFSEEEEKFWKNRLILPANTYAYKLVGPLYLKTKLNTVDSFEWSIQGLKNDNDTITLKTIGRLIYNCPDIFKEGDGNDIYNTFDDNSLQQNYNNKWGYNLFCRFDDRSSIVSTLTNNNNFSTKYNEVNDKYYANITKWYETTAIPNGAKYLNYGIGVPTFLDSTIYNSDSNKNYYLSNFWSEGSLELELLGSGQVKLTEWRFYNDWDEESDDATCYISYNFLTYPKIDLEFSNLLIAFTTLLFDENDQPTWHNLSDIIGKKTIESTWTELGLNPQHLYWVHFKYDTKYPDNVGNTITEPKIEANKAFFLTTKHFNECYIPGSDFINHFNKFFNSDNSNYISSANTKEQEIVNKYKTILVKPEFEIGLKLEKDVDIDNISLLSNNNGNFTIKNNYKLRIEGKILNPRISYNEIEYPKNIVQGLNSQLTYEIKIEELNNIIPPEKITTIGNPEVSITLGTNAGSDVINKISSYTSPTQNLNMSFELNDCLKAKPLDTFTLTNQFETVKNAVEHQMGLNDYCYVGLFLGFEAFTGNDDRHFVNLVSLKKNTRHSDGFEYVTEYLNDSTPYPRGDLNTALAHFSCDITDGNGYDGDPYHPWGIGNGSIRDLDNDEVSLFGVANKQYPDGKENKFVSTLKYATMDGSGLSYQYNLDQIDSHFNNYPLLTHLNFSFLFFKAYDNDSHIPKDSDSENHQRFFLYEKRKQNYGTLNYEKTILFWNRGYDIVLYPNLVEYSSNDKLDVITNTFGQAANLYYAYYAKRNITSSDGIYRPDYDNYIYLKPYNIKIPTTFKSTINNPTTSISLVDDNYYAEFATKIFELSIVPEETKTDSVSTEIGYFTKDTLNIIMNEEYDSIAVIVDENNNSITGKLFDADGNRLDKLFMYNSKLLKISNEHAPFSISNTITDIDTRLLLPKNVTSGIPQGYKYLMTGLKDKDGDIVVDEDHTTCLEFLDVRTMKPITKFGYETEEFIEKPKSTTVVTTNSGGGNSVYVYPSDKNFNKYTEKLYAKYSDDKYFIEDREFYTQL